MSDDQLLAAWRTGDKRAGERLFDRHFRALTRFFRNKVEHGIEDLIQSTLLGLLEAQPRFRGDGDFRGFVFGVANNVLHNHYRSRRRDARHLDFGVTSIHDLAAGPSELLADKDEQRLLLEALRRIPIAHQILLELYFWEPLSAPEIAHALAIPVGTVRTRIRRAKALLEARMGELSGDRRLLESTVSKLDDWARSVRGGVCS